MENLAVGIAGAVGRGAAFIKVFQSSPHTRVAALCDINEEKLRERASEFGVESVYTSYEEMLGKANLDIVLVATPMQLHADQCIAALERDIHVLSEVTAVVSIEQAKALVTACRNSRAKYMMAENMCYTRSNVLIREIAKAGLFGELYFGEGEYVHEVREIYTRTPWRREWAAGRNGNTYPTHSLGPVYQWLGGQRVTEVCCYGTGNHYQDPQGRTYELSDSTFTACRMGGGGLVNLRLDLLSERPPIANCYSLQGTRGCYESPRSPGERDRIHLADRHERHTWHDLDELAGEFLPEEWRNPSEEALASDHAGGDWMVAVEFIKSIVEDTDSPIGIHEALDITLPGLVSQESIAQGSVWLPVPDSREF